MTSTDTGPLILGATGRVGRALCAVWPCDAPVLWQHRPGRRPPAEPALSWDILAGDPPRLPGSVSGIVQLARGADAAEEVALGQAACDLGARLGVPVLLASSQAVYGAGEGTAPETRPPAPGNDYGRAKCALEMACADRAVILRIGNVAGCDMLLGNAARGPVTLDQLPDGTTPQRSYIGPDALGHVIRALVAQQTPPMVLNVAQPGQVAMGDLLDAAGCDWQPRAATPLPVPALDVSQLMARVPLPEATASGLIAAARAAGWRAAS